MTTTTTYLNLFKYVPSADGNLTFSITSALNNNWDKLANECSSIRSSLSSKVNSSSLTQVQVVTETYSNGDSWYRVWSDGWCEQGGTIVGTTTNNTTISLLKAYRDTSYSVVFGNLYKAATATTTPIVASTTKTSSSFQVYDSTDANFSTYWISYGYLY